MCSHQQDVQEAFVMVGPQLGLLKAPSITGRNLSYKELPAEWALVWGTGQAINITRFWKGKVDDDDVVLCVSVSKIPHELLGQFEWFVSGNSH